MDECSVHVPTFCGVLTLALEIEDVVRIVRVSEVQVSSRGDIASIHVRPDLEKNRNLSEIRVYTRDDKVVFFTPGQGDTMPRWSPESRLLAFLSRRGASKDDKGIGVFVASLAGGEPRKVAWFKHGVSWMDWYDMDRLVVFAPVARENDYDDDYVATDKLPLWFDGEGLIAGLDSGVYLVSWDSGFTDRIAVEKDTIFDATVCGDGSIYYTVPQEWREPYKHVLKRVKPGQEPEVIAKGWGIRGLYCMSNGRLLSLATRHPIGIASHSRLYEVDPFTGEFKPLAQGFEPNIWSIAGEVEGEPVINYVWRGSSILAKVGVGGVVRITPEKQYVMVASARGDRVAYWKSSPTEPPELYSWREDEGERRLTNLNQWVKEKAKLVEPRHYITESQGDRVDYWVIDPKPGEEKPVILYVHGGPKGMYGFMFHPEMQFYASQGFMIVYGNPRGSDGYEEEFADIRGKYGDVDYRQLMDLLDNALENHVADKTRLVVTGISYGGYMTNLIITKTDRFAAAVSENGIADWTTDYWSSDIGYWFDPDQIGRTPLENLEEYVKKSPAYHVDGVKTPLLLIHSMEDYRCPIDQALSMHAAMLSRGKDSKLVVFKKGSHGFSVRGEPQTRVKRLKIKTKWIRMKLGLDELEDKSKNTR